MRPALAPGYPINGILGSMTRLMTVLIAFSGMAVAQQAPAGWKVMKSEKASCQVAVPGDWAIDNAFQTASSPNKLLSVSILHEKDVDTGPSVSDDLRIAAYSPVKVFENTSKRVFLEDKAAVLGPAKPGRKFVAFVPHSSKGICQAILSLKSGGPEELAKQVVLTVSVAR